jgi:hypothetical protein
VLRSRRAKLNLHFPIHTYILIKHSDNLTFNLLFLTTQTSSQFMLLRMTGKLMYELETIDRLCGLEVRPPGSSFDSRSYRTFWEVVSLELGPLSLVSTTEELLGRKGSDFGLESRKYGRMHPSRWPRGTVYPQKLALTSPTSGGRSAGIVRSRIQSPEFSLILVGNDQGGSADSLI